MEPDLVVVGAGAAGLAAALESARLGLRTSVIDPAGAGGLVLTAEAIDGCPGIAAKMTGNDLIARLTEQVMELDVTIEFAEVTSFSVQPGAPRVGRRRTQGRRSARGHRRSPEIPGRAR
jgi:thioredoxin reductase